MCEKEILYVCDRTKCENCYEECHYTTDIKHAISFDYKKLEVANGKIIGEVFIEIR